ncbi:MAG: 3-isopropylmalate dehydratase small subunit [Pirellulaceae bacterium]|jgi:3-isopropylmalate/(R)-2-methylmalate dehydratase small subunit|nr:3-isopropylmalate dehydratase small subunit [Pirellulaceae bacterium]MDP7020552.1 3-isopropylmalate dehydratase small subunit [Pirellulaceae bacterium]
MESFTVHKGVAATMDRADVDTDQIIPKQFLKRIERSGFEDFLFYDWRFLDDGSPNPDFELNLPRNAGASVLIARRNFGCGSSREHAVWALENYGIRAVIAPSFADIFYNNCFKNGVLPVQLDENLVQQLFDAAAATDVYRVEVDLEQRTLTDGAGFASQFDVDDFRRRCLLNGLDDIALTMQHEDKIAAFEAQR